MQYNPNGASNAATYVDETSKTPVNVEARLLSVNPFPPEW